MLIPTRFRKNLIFFLVIFGVINVILIVLYPKIYSGEFSGDLTKPTPIDDLNTTTGGKTQTALFTRIFSNLDLSKHLAGKGKEDLEDVGSGSREPNAGGSQPITERSNLKLSTKLMQTSAKVQNIVTSASPKEQPIVRDDTRSTSPKVVSNTFNSTKQNTTIKTSQTPTSAWNSTTPFQYKLVEEPFCKLYKLSEKSIEYTTSAYAIRPEIRKCHDQKAPPYELCKINETKSNSSENNLEIKCDFNICDKTKKMSVEFMDYGDGYMKEKEIPKTSTNMEIEKLVLQVAEEVRKHDLPFVFVNCTAVDGAIVSQILTFLPPLPRLQDNAHRDKININIFLVDSVSRPHFYRSFPDTVDYLKVIKNDSNYPAHVFNFEFFQAVHGHTNENERALFNGSVFPAHLSGKTRDRTPVNLNPLYKVFKESGFQTMFLDDLCWRGHWGIMDKYKVGSWKSLQSKLSESDIDSRGMSEASCTILRRNKMTLPFYARKNHQICYNGRHTHEYLLDYVNKYIDAIRKPQQCKPLFLYTTTHVSHDDGGVRVQTFDIHLKDFIQKMSTKENTLSIIFADHGNTYTSYQAREDGKQEMYHPFLLIIVPKKLGKRFGGNVLRNLHENQKRLCHLFDIRASLLELSRYDGKSPLKPTGIFGKIAPDRSCDNLLLTKESKCICRGWETPVANTTEQLVFAEFAIGEMNNRIQQSLLESREKGVAYDKSRVVFGACQRLRVQNIRNVKIRKTPDGRVTTIDVRVQSSNLVAQEELITVQVVSMQNPTGTYEMKLLSHNRLSTYGHYRECMDKNVDVKVCVCNNPEDPKPQTTVEEVVGKHSEVTKMQQCLYKVRRSYDDTQNELLVQVFEVFNVCRDQEFSVTFEADDDKSTILSTRTPITVRLPPQTAQFIATTRTKGKDRTTTLNIKWRLELFV